MLHLVPVVVGRVKASIAVNPGGLGVGGWYVKGGVVNPVQPLHPPAATSDCVALTCEVEAPTIDWEPVLLEAIVQPCAVTLVLPPNDNPPAPASMHTGPVAANAATAVSPIVTLLRKSAENSGVGVAVTTAFPAVA